MKLRLGIAGAGIFARSTHRPAILRHPKVELAGIYSRTPESLDAFCREMPDPTQEHLHRYIDFQDFCRASAFEAIDIVLPIPVMGDYLRQAIGSGKHLLSEKPIAASSREAIALLETWRNAKHCSVWLVSENWRLLESFLTARMILESGRIGRPIWATVRSSLTRSPDSPYEQCAWRQELKPRWGWLVDAGVHVTAILRILFGEIGKVNSTRGSTQIASGRHIEEVRAELIFPGNIPAAVNFKYLIGAGSENHFSVDVHIQGTHGSMVVDRETIRVCDPSGISLQEDHFSPHSFDRVLDVFVQTIESGDFDNPDNPLHPAAAVADLQAVEAIRNALWHWE